MLYLDYDRAPEGDVAAQRAMAARRTREAIEFLRRMNEALLRHFEGPGIVTIGG